MRGKALNLGLELTRQTLFGIPALESYSHTVRPACGVRSAWKEVKSVLEENIQPEIWETVAVAHSASDRELVIR